VKLDAYRFNHKSKRNRPESDIQARFFSWLLKSYPELRLQCFSIPNGGSRNVLEAMNLKKTGLTPGTPDVFCSIPSGAWHGLFIEFKAGRNKLTDAQKIMFDKFSSAGYKCEVCYSFEESVKVFKNYVGEN
jgi:hypothetical protein